MKIRFKHPILVSVKSPRSDKSTKTVLTTTTTFEIPRFDLPMDAVEALAYRKPKHTETTRFLEKDGSFFRPEHLPDGMATDKHSPISAINNREVTLAVSSHLYHSAVAELDGIKLTKAEKERLSKSLLDQPDIESIPQGRIDWDDNEAEKSRIFREISNFALIGKHLCRRCPEPFYSVSQTYNRVELSIVTDEDIPADMVAAFRIGRLEEARAFAENLAGFIQVFRGGVPVAIVDNASIVENGAANSGFDDVGVTLAVALHRAVNYFRGQFNHEYSGKNSIDELIYKVPLEQLELVREMKALIDNRGFYALAGDADKIGDIIERAVGFGERSRFTGGVNYPLHLIHELWTDREISFVPAQGPTP